MKVEVDAVMGPNLQKIMKMASEIDSGEPTTAQFDSMWEATIQKILENPHGVDAESIRESLTHAAEGFHSLGIVAARLDQAMGSFSRAAKAMATDEGKEDGG